MVGHGARHPHFGADEPGPCFTRAEWWVMARAIRTSARMNRRPLLRPRHVVGV